MPRIQVLVERIIAERTPEQLQGPIRYTSSLNITKIKESLEAGEALYEFRFTCIAMPAIVSMSISGKAVLALTEKEREEFKTKKEEEKVKLVANTVFPHVLGTIVMLSRELQVPPPLPQPATSTEMRPGTNLMQSM